MALGAIAAHKLRSALTLLGILVGVFSIIIVMTTVRAMQNQIEDQIRQLGSETFMVDREPSMVFDSPEGQEKYWRRKRLTLAQGFKVQEKATLAKSVGIQTDFWGGQIETRFAKTAPGVSLLGETAGSFPARNWTVEEGRALLDVDVENARDVCVLGSTVAKTVFPHSTAIGERLKVNGVNYTVVGVLQGKGQSLDGDQDNFVVLPITTGMNRFGQSQWRDISILVQAQDAASYDETVDQVRGILRLARKVPPGKEDDFEIFSNDSMIAQFQSFTRAVRIGISLVSSIALLAAGVGIMNIMLVSVTERTREIGIRRAIGAKKRSIMTQFIMEAIVLCEIGGAIGVVLGIVGGNVAAVLLKMSPVIPVDWVVFGLLICSVVGIIFGTYPAYKAANLDPIESLRYE